MFGSKHWEPATGTVIDSRVDKVKVYDNAGTSTTREFVVEVTTAGGEVFRSAVKTPRNAGDFKDPRIGAAVKVEFDPKSRKVRFDKSDESLSMKADERARRASFDASLTERRPPEGR